MRRDFTTRKRAILGGLIVLVAADVALAVYSSYAPQAGAQQLALQEQQLNVLKGAIVRAQKIKDEVPSTQQDCTQFEQSLLPASTGYSSVSSELGGMAKKSGVQLQDLSFKPTPVPERGLTEVAMDSNIQGDYKNVVLFLNELQRSTKIYEVDSLALAPGGQSQGPANIIKVGLHLRTYFRTAA